jgi:hypothetical protein
MVAGRGLAQLLTDGQIVTVYYEPSSSSAAATCSGCRWRCTWWRVFAVTRC